MEPCFPGDDWTPAWWWEVMNSFLCFACECSFCFTYYTVFISSHEFSHLYSSDSLPHPTRQEWVSGCLVLSCHLGLNHDIPSPVSDTLHPNQPTLSPSIIVHYQWYLSQSSEHVPIYHASVTSIMNFKQFCGIVHSTPLSVSSL